MSAEITIYLHFFTSRQQTTLKEGNSLPPADLLMRQLIELSNAENPPCANCDKRDKASMYFCSTCGRLLFLL
jgi:hypothetical protein